MAYATGARRNQMRDYLYGECKKPGRKGAPADAILDAYASGKNPPEIRRIVTRPDGQMFSITTIRNVIARARDEGDRRVEP